MPAEKIIRDRLAGKIPPERLRQTANPAEFLEFLDQKLDEELAELRASQFNDVDEFADLFQVLIALGRRRGISFAKIQKARRAKLTEKGGFETGLIYRIEA